VTRRDQAAWFSGLRGPLIGALVFNLGSAAWWRESILLLVNIAFLAGFSQDPVAFLPYAGFLAVGFIAQSITRGGPRAACSAARQFCLGSTLSSGSAIRPREIRSRRPSPSC
jgi:hypothetical protein